MKTEEELKRDEGTRALVEVTTRLFSVLVVCGLIGYSIYEWNVTNILLGFVVLNLRRPLK